MAETKRIRSFKVNAESVQGVKGAEITVKAIRQDVWKRYLSDPAYGDAQFVKDHIIDWKGFVGENDKPLPSPADDPEVFGQIYMHETGRLSRLVANGPDGEHALKN